MSQVADEVVEQLASNASGSGHLKDFAGHRDKTTSCVLSRAPAKGGRLCVLGAGNCHDIDLGRLAARFDEIHLVDIDASALERGFARVGKATQPRVLCHAPVDLSGLVDRLDRWQQQQVTPDELLNHPANTAERLALAIGSGYDVVLSACLLTQMQLMVVNVLTDSHRLFEAVRYTLTLTHFRTLHRLLAPGGSALLTIDATADAIAPLGSLAPPRDLTALLDDRVRSGAIFFVAHPGLLRSLVTDDEILARDTRFQAPLDVWPWQNGPKSRFLVYLAELRRNAPRAR